MFSIRGIELSHHHAPLEIRESLEFDTQKVLDCLGALQREVPEVYILNTCNRLAIYGTTHDTGLLEKAFDHVSHTKPFLRRFHSTDASVTHLFSTAAGLESQALGEHEILGQIKRFHSLAMGNGKLGPVTDELVRRAISVGKKVRKQTAIGQYPTSLASVSLDVARKEVHNFNESNVLILGTGEMANLLLKILAKKHLGGVWVASKTLDRAEEIARHHKVHALTFDQVEGLLPQMDIVISATQTTDSYVLGPEHMETLSKKLTVVDLGLPRNINPNSRRNHWVSLFDLDDLKLVNDESLQRRQEEIPKVSQIIDEEKRDFLFWLNARKVSPAIKNYYEKLHEVKAEALQWALPKMGELNEVQTRLMEAAMDRMLRRMSGKAVEQLQKYAQDSGSQEYPLDTFRNLFGLQGE